MNNRAHSLYGFELQISPHTFRLAALPQQPILLYKEPEGNQKGAVILVRQDETPELFDRIYQELGALIKKCSIESLPMNLPEECFSDKAIQGIGVHLRFSYRAGETRSFFYSLNDVPGNINNLISECRLLTRRVLAVQSKQIISGEEAKEHVKNDANEDIIPRFNKYIFEHPDDAQAYNDRGMAYLRLENSGKALEDFTTAIELNPSFSRAYFNRGWIYYSQAEWEKALTDLTTAIELNSQLPEAYNNRGIIYCIQKEYDKGIDDFKKAMECAPSSESAYSNLGNAYHDLKQYDQALVFYNKAIELAPTLAKNYCNRGKLYYDFKKYELALPDYNKALEIDHNYTQVYYNRAQVLVDMGNYTSARDDFSKVIESDPNDSHVYVNRAYCFLAEYKYSEAIADCDIALAKNTALPLAYFYRAQAKRLQKKFDESFSDLKKAEELGFIAPQEFKNKLSLELKNVNQGKVEKDINGGSSKIKSVNSKKSFKPYWELSYKEKFRRNVYGLVFTVIAITLLAWKINKAYSVLFICVIGGIIQLIYVFIKWKNGEKQILSNQKSKLESARKPPPIVIDPSGLTGMEVTQAEMRFLKEGTVIQDIDDISKLTTVGVPKGTSVYIGAPAKKPAHDFIKTLHDNAVLHKGVESVYVYQIIYGKGEPHITVGVCFSEKVDEDTLRFFFADLGSKVRPYLKENEYVDFTELKEEETLQTVKKYVKPVFQKQKGPIFLCKKAIASFYFRFASSISSRYFLMTDNAPKRPENWCDKIILLFAGKLYEDSYRLNSNRNGALLFAGKCYQSLSNHKIALEYFKRLWVTDPFNSITFKEIGTECLALERYEEGLQFALKEVSQFPKNAESQAHLAMLLLLSKRIDEAYIVICRAKGIDGESVYVRDIYNYIEAVNAGKRSKQ